MAGYIAPVTVHYTKGSESPADANRIAPAPLISISPEIYYANDNVVGYTYNISLRGYANALRKENDEASTDYGLAPTLEHMGEIRNIFSFNGGNLHIKLTNGISDTILAKGATIKSINFDNSENKWFNYAPFTVELEFNEIDLIGCSGNVPINCDSSIFHQINNSNNINDNLINIELYKIKEFNDKWSFTIDDKIYNPNNESIAVSYTLSAVGKNYYINDNLVPAWQQAKMFVQQRTRSQVLQLIDGVLPIENNNMDSCEATKNLSQIHDLSPNGILSGFNGNYDIYNETITCDISESDGSFSLTYNAILKNAGSGAAIHSYSKDYSSSYEGGTDATINIKGTVQGLIRGGFIYYDFNDFELPNQGSFLIPKNGNETKYDNAISYYLLNIGGTSDLSNNIKNILNVTKRELLIKGTDGYPTPVSFVLEHNYLDGQLTYNAAYDRKHTISKDKGYTNISIVRTDPIDVIQQFVIPGRSGGPIIQKLNMKSSRTISINIDGASQNNKNCVITNICDLLPQHNIDKLYSILAEKDTLIKTKEDYSVNPIDGSFSINLEFIETPPRTI